MCVSEYGKFIIDDHVCRRHKSNLYEEIKFLVRFMMGQGDVECKFFFGKNL